ncbi:50S ribosome-binding GTPase [Fragilaria crotonensis]|nr:50S ribosome-binding GTPase [Fragilaria crotonensis]
MRNPLFYVSEDLRSYAVEELGKPMLLVVNKSDYLSKSQRKEWHNYFKAKGWDHLFFSAHQEQEKLDRAAFEERKEARELPSIQSDENDIDENDNDEEESNDIDENDNDEEELNEIDGDDKVPSQPVDVGETGGASTPTKRIKSRENIGIEMPLTREELLDWLQSFAAQYSVNPTLDSTAEFSSVWSGFQTLENLASSTFWLEAPNIRMASSGLLSHHNRERQSTFKLSFCLIVMT